MPTYIDDINVGGVLKDIYAKQLSTPRTINGVAFDGSSNISNYGVCTTAAATSTKTVTITDFTLAAGASAVIKFTNENTAAVPSLNINGTGAKALTNKNWTAGDVMLVTYDGTSYNGSVTTGGVAEQLSGYLPLDGYSENATVGNAEQLVSTVFVNDKVPYTFRTSGGSADIGDREYDTIVGGSLAWNQLMQDSNLANVTFRATKQVNGNTVRITDDRTTANASFGCANRFNGAIPSNHVVLVNFNIDEISAGSGFNHLNIYMRSSSQTTINLTDTTTPGQYSQIKKLTIEIADVAMNMHYNSAITGDADYYVYSNLQVHDLTAMFGTEIADYIYTLEQSTPGAGVAWFKKLFPKPYYAYNAGELLSVSGVSAHNMTGFNQWDEEWEVGGIDATTGQNAPASNTIRSKNYIRCLPNTTYFFKSTITAGGAAFYWYDVNQNYLGTYVSITRNTTFTTPANVYYMRFKEGTTYGTTYNNDICINLHWDGERNGEYEPYVLHSYPLDSSLTLRGIPKLDANDSLYYDGDTYESDGTVTRRYIKITLTGTETGLRKVGVTTVDAFSFDDVVSTTNAFAGGSNIFSNRFLYTPTITTVANGINFTNTRTIAVSFPAGTFVDLAAFKTWCAANPIEVIYELATPTTEIADSYQSPQIVDDWGTEQYVVTAQGDVEIPVGHDTNYANNLRAKIEMAPESPAGDGDYIVRQTSGQNVYVPLVLPLDELPAAPGTDGTYTLQVTVSGGNATYAWV